MGWPLLGHLPVPLFSTVGLLLGLLPALRRDRRLGLGAVLLGSDWLWQWLFARTR